MLSPEEHEYRRFFCTGCGHVIDAPVYCGNRFCPVCTKRRQFRVRQRLTHMMGFIKESHPYSLKHLTLTIPNQKSASKAARQIVSAFRRVRRRELWKRYVKGGAFVIEATGESGNWHVHVHAIIESKFFPWEQLHALWMEVSPGRGVFLQKIPVGKVIAYLTKYMTKTDVPQSDVDELAAALKGFRMFQPFGSWHRLPAAPPLKAMKCPSCGTSNWLPDRLCTAAGAHRIGQRGKSRASPRAAVAASVPV